jgi:hypothetical protein
LRLEQRADHRRVLGQLALRARPRAQRRDAQTRPYSAASITRCATFSAMRARPTPASCRASSVSSAASAEERGRVSRSSSSASDGNEGDVSAAKTLGKSEDSRSLRRGDACRSAGSRTEPLRAHRDCGARWDPGNGVTQACNKNHSHLYCNQPKGRD